MRPEGAAGCRSRPSSSPRRSRAKVHNSTTGTVCPPSIVSPSLLRRRFISRVAKRTVISFFGLSIPSFWFALMLIMVFAVELHWFPAQGMRSIGVRDPVDVAWHLVLPAFVDGHCHLDMTFLGAPWQPHLAAGSLRERIANGETVVSGL